MSSSNGLYLRHFGSLGFVNSGSARDANFKPRLKGRAAQDQESQRKPPPARSRTWCRAQAFFLRG